MHPRDESSCSEFYEDTIFRSRLLLYIMTYVGCTFSEAMFLSLEHGQERTIRVHSPIKYIF
jgi:hypothetical protein